MRRSHTKYCIAHGPVFPILSVSMKATVFVVQNATGRYYSVSNIVCIILYCTFFFYREPAVIILDGTALSCRKELVPNSVDQLPDNLRTLSGLSHAERVFIWKKETRYVVS